MNVDEKRNMMRRLVDNYLERLDEAFVRLRERLPDINEVSDSYLRERLNSNARVTYGILSSFLENENKQLKYFYSDVSVEIERDKNSLERVYLVRGDKKGEVTKIRLVALNQNQVHASFMYLTGHLYHTEQLTEYESAVESSVDIDRQKVFKLIDSDVLNIVYSLIDHVDKMPADGISKTELTPADVSYSLFSSIKIDDNRRENFSVKPWYQGGFISLNNENKDIIDFFIENPFFVLVHSFTCDNKNILNVSGSQKISYFNNKLLKEAEEKLNKRLPLIRNAVITHVVLRLFEKKGRAV